MKRVVHRQPIGLAAVMAAWLMLPTPALAQRVGIATTVEGAVMVTRPTASQPQPLRFKDEVFVQDRITTGQQSVLRILLGGVAVVTMRERSLLRVAQEMDLELPTGKIALAVAGEKLRGVCPDIRTPNAIVKVCGTIVIAEVSQTGAPTSPCSGDLTSRFTVTKGVISVAGLDPATGRPRGDWVHLGPSQTITISGCNAPARPAPDGKPVPGDIGKVSSTELQALSETFRLRPSP